MDLWDAEKESARKKRRLSRREALKAGAAAAAAVFPASARAVRGPGAGDDGYDFLLPTVKLHCFDRNSDRWHAYPGAHRNLLSELNSVLRCRVKLPQNCRDSSPRFGRENQFNAVVTLDNIEPLRRFPFLFMTAEGQYTLNTRQLQVLAQYIREGGFVLMDDCVQEPQGDRFYRSSYKILEHIFGQGSIVSVANDHEVFQNVYDLRDTGLPYVPGLCTNHGAKGIFHGERLAVFLCSTDLHCGWAGSFGGYEGAIQMGINLILYALSH